MSLNEKLTSDVLTLTTLHKKEALSAAAAFFLFQRRIKIQYLKTAITSLFFRIQKNFIYENDSPNNNLSKCMTSVFSGKI
jgi:hypothetical protein